MKCYVYRHFNENDELLYAGVSLNVFKRTEMHKSKSEWFHEIRKITIEPYESIDDAVMVEKIVIATECPKYNKNGKGDIFGEEYEFDLRGVQDLFREANPELHASIQERIKRNPIKKGRMLHNAWKYYQLIDEYSAIRDGQ